MNETTPKISVIVPVYKAEAYLHRCVDSILAQTFQDFEVLLIDDGSPDKSGEICDEYAKMDTRVRVFHKENGGVSSARNMGLENAKGEWIIFADADDYFLLSNAFALLLECVIKSQASIVLADALILENGKYRILLGLEDCIQPNNIYTIKHFALWGYMFNAELIRSNKIRFIEGLAYSEDRIFIYQITQYCKEIVFSKELIYVYRINDSSACKSRDGLKKACSQIDAACQIRMLAQTHFVKATHGYKFLLRQSRNIANDGIYQFVSLGFSVKNITIVAEKYVGCFGYSLSVWFYFYIRLLIISIKYFAHRIYKKIV